MSRDELRNSIRKSFFFIAIQIIVVLKINKRVLRKDVIQESFINKFQDDTVKSLRYSCMGQLEPRNIICITADSGFSRLRHYIPAVFNYTRPNLRDILHAPKQYVKREVHAVGRKSERELT